MTDAIKNADPKWLYQLGWPDGAGNSLHWRNWVGRLRPIEVTIAELLNAKPSEGAKPGQIRAPYWRRAQGNTFKEKQANIVPPKPVGKTDWRRRKSQAKKGINQSV